jgi:phage terminase large subunit
LYSTKNLSTYTFHRQNQGDYTLLPFRLQGPPLAAPAYRARLMRKWIEGSNVVHIRATGEFRHQNDEVLIALDLTGHI